MRTQNCRFALFATASRMVLLASLATAFPSHASLRFEQGQGAFPKPPKPISDQPILTEDAPVFMEADNLDYDKESEIAVASGHVAITQGATIIMADYLAYDRKHNLVTAHGNVSMLEPSGNVYFADEMELQNDMRSGVVKQFRARLADDSVFAAASAHRIDEEHTELDRAVYSPCNVKCEADGGGDPMWQIKAAHVMIDDTKQKVLYDDTTFEAYGVPVFYTPYFSHPTPDADNQSGLLVPEYLHTDNLGSVYKVPVYYAIAPDKDATITPIYTSNEGVVMAGEYRQMFDSGDMAFDGSITRPHDRDPQGNLANGKQIRGHINGRGQFDLNDYSDWGFDIRRTTDDTYLRRYNFSEDTLLTSKVFAESFNFLEGGGDRTFARMQALSFQGLNAQDNSKRIPFALPLADFNYETEPGAYNSRIFVDGNMLALFREEGADSRRVSMTAGWRLPYLTQNGQIIEFETQLRNDIYSVSDVDLGGGREFDGVTGRIIPQVSLRWRYPFINQFAEQSSLLIEPVVTFDASPSGGNPGKIPNEDSLVPEFTDANLFATDRFPGYDRVETGPRVSYGLRGQAQFSDKNYIDWLFGQHYRLNNDGSFPFTNDLSSHYSDYVGKIGIDYRPLTLAYRFRLDKDTMTPKRSEVDASYGNKWGSISGSYLSLTNDPVLANKEEIVGSTTANLTDNWSWTLTGRRDLVLDQITSTATGFTFHNECTNISLMAGKEYTRDRDIKPDTTFLVRISLRNLE